MKEFIDTRHWPLVSLHMPHRVADEQANGMIEQFESLYARAQPFVLLMDGVEFPRQSGRFMATCAQWSRDRFTEQQRYCLGAIRIEADETLRRAFTRRAQGWNASGRAPYPYRVVATRWETETQARDWLAGRSPAAV
ncbi:hypothetical protein [Verminephrobacter aporrectodeae]|uniref:hypothetical protein n=1 Tax=Verminephrobacter aporrectodeae TaxID=1110389 RepID=UPI00030B85CE|nr:hypothetical protein [Verminephrobacter aporrectodeae]